MLHTGDSMVGSHGGLTRALRRRFEGIGAEFVSDHKTSASITTFARSPHLDQLLGAHDPDLVVLTLGANDARAPRPEVFAPAVAQVVAKLAGRACVWIGPPLGTPRGISRVIRENAGHCAFFDSSELVIRRGPDGVHPTDRGGAEWADAFWAAFYPAGDGADGGDSGRDGSAPP